MGLTSAPVAFEDAPQAVYGGGALAEGDLLDELAGLPRPWSSDRRSPSWPPPYISRIQWPVASGGAEAL